MHELPVTQNILEIALRHAEEAGAKKILCLNITIGALASIVDDSVQFYWDIISKDTIAEGAQLAFTRIPTSFHCRDCDFDYKPADGISMCPKCGGNHVKITTGQEFYLDSIDVE
jgi:hydrogenase nickel incorporation protein HypA/HybF